MKKILTVFFCAVSLSLSAQISDTTWFNNVKPMLGDPAAGINFWTGNAFFHGNIIADTVWANTHYVVVAYDTIQTVDSLSVTGNTNIRGNLSVNDTLFWNTIYPTPFDSTHCWSKLYTDSLSSCSPLVIYSIDTSYYTALGHRFKNAVYTDNGITNTGNFTSTKGNINITNGTGSVIIDSNWFGAINGGHFGAFKGSLVTGTSIGNGLTFIEDGNKESYMGYHRQVGGSSKNQKAIEYDTTRISVISGLNNRETSITIRDTGYHIKVPSKTIMSADSGGNHIKFYSPLYINSSLALAMSDTTSTLLTQSKATNTYQLKYWSKSGTAIQPYTATDTVIAPYIRLKNIHTTGTVLTEVTSTGLLDTIATTPINPIYVKKAGDTMGGSLIMNSGSILFDDYAFASGDKVAVIHESGLLDTATTVTIDNADINTITISDSIRIGGLWYIGDTAIIADEDSIIIPINKSMFGQIFVDSVGYMVAYVNSFYVDINGTPHLISNSSRVIATNTDTNAICLYAYAGNLILRNRSGSTLKYKIILNG